MPDPNADAVNAEPEWLWSRSVPWSTMEHDVANSDAQRVLDSYDWKARPMHGDGREVDKIMREWVESQRRQSPAGPSVGETHHSAVFTSADVATRYGVSVPAVSNMIRRKTWAHVA